MNGAIEKNWGTVATGEKTSVGVASNTQQKDGATVSGEEGIDYNGLFSDTNRQLGELDKKMDQVCDTNPTDSNQVGAMCLSGLVSEFGGQPARDVVVQNDFRPEVSSASARNDKVEKNPDETANAVRSFGI